MDVQRPAGYGLVRAQLLLPVSGGWPASKLLNAPASCRMHIGTAALLLWPPGRPPCCFFHCSYPPLVSTSFRLHQPACSCLDPPLTNALPPACRCGNVAAILELDDGGGKNFKVGERSH